MEANGAKVAAEGYYRKKWRWLGNSDMNLAVVVRVVVGRRRFLRRGERGDGVL